MPPSIPSIVSPALLSSIRAHPHLPSHTWYFITGATLSALNRPDEIPAVFKYALEKQSGPAEKASEPEEDLTIARKMREALVKTAAIVGLPKVSQVIRPYGGDFASERNSHIFSSQTINALIALKGETPPHLLDEPLAYSPTNRPVEVYDVPSSRILHRGQTFFDHIYGKVSKRVMGQMDRSGTEDLGITARLMYGYILSNTSVLTAAESSFVLMAGLIPQDVSFTRNCCVGRKSSVKHADRYQGQPTAKRTSEGSLKQRRQDRRSQGGERSRS